MAHIGTRLFTWLRGRPVGTDAFGNRYYMERRAPKQGRAKRWVVYEGIPEPSKVPPLWHAWLHYTTDTPPHGVAAQTHEWQKPHQPNLTGTAGAYFPPGHILRGGARDATRSDYEPWTPTARPDAAQKEQTP
jgi:NADH:ubiquinone oxidoreductase subunit